MGRKKTVAVDDAALVHVVIEAIREIKGNKIVKLDLTEIGNTVCDYFIICEAESTTHVNAIADNIDKQTDLQLQSSPHHIEGRENAQWILLDYFSVIVHVFLRENREFYRLEELWSDAKFETISE